MNTLASCKNGNPLPIGFVLDPQSDSPRVIQATFVARSSNERLIVFRYASELGSELKPAASDCGIEAPCRCLDFQPWIDNPSCPELVRIREALGGPPLYIAETKLICRELPKGTSSIRLGLLCSEPTSNENFWQLNDCYFAERRRAKLALGEKPNSEYGFLITQEIAKERLEYVAETLRAIPCRSYRDDAINANALFNLTVRLYGGFDSPLLWGGY